MTGVPDGDPVRVLAAADHLDALADEHAAQSRRFQDAGEVAMRRWTGGYARQYHTDAADTLTRFGGVTTALRETAAALRQYADALEQARGRLAVSCPDTMTGAQLLSYVSDAARHLHARDVMTSLDLVLTGVTLFDAAEHSAEAGKLGDAANTAQKEMLTVQRLAREAAALLGRSSKGTEALAKWADLEAISADRYDKAADEVLAKGGNWLHGLLRTGTIDTEIGAHAAQSDTIAGRLLDAFLHAGKIPIAADTVGIGTGIYDLIDPAHEKGWEFLGDQVGGGMSSAGGTAALASWALASLGADGVVAAALGPAGAALLLGAAAWTAGSFAYDEARDHWKGITRATDVARHQTAHDFDATRHEAAHLLDDLNPF